MLAVEIFVWVVTAALVLLAAGGGAWGLHLLRQGRLQEAALMFGIVREIAFEAVHWAEDAIKGTKAGPDRLEAATLFVIEKLKTYGITLNKEDAMKFVQSAFQQAKGSLNSN